MVPDGLRRQLRGLYPGARIAQLKATGDFPYLSRPDEVTLFIEVHLRSAGDFSVGVAAQPQPQPEASTARVWQDDIDVDVHARPSERRVANSWVNPFEDDLL